MTAIRQIAFTVALCFLFFKASDIAIRSGSIWESIAHPTKNVSVKLHGLGWFDGELSRNWSDDFVITSASGVARTFNEFDAMHIKASPSELQYQKENRSIWYGWRQVLPVALVTAFASLLLALTFAFSKKKES